MTDDELSMTRRRVLQASGATIVAGGTFGTFVSGTSARGQPDNDLVSTDLTEIGLDDCDSDTDAFTVSVAGPPFGRTDVTAEGANASPSSFRLGGRGDSETVTVGPGDGTVTVTATTPRGDSQTTTVSVTCPEPEFDVTLIEVPEEVEVGTTLEVVTAVTNAGDGAGTQDVAFSVGGDDAETVDDLSLDPGESEEVEFTHDVEKAGSLSFEVSTDDDSVGDTVEVIEPEAEFAVTILADDPITIDPADHLGDPFWTFRATIENLGNAPAEQPIALTIDGPADIVEVIGDVADPVELDPEAAEEVEFYGFIDREVADGYEFTATVESNDDEDEISIEVVESPF